MFLVGMLFGPPRTFRRGVDDRDRLVTGSIQTLARTMPTFPLLRDHEPALRAVGRAIHVEDCGRSIHVVCEITDPAFDALDERRWLSAAFDGPEHAVDVSSGHVTYDGVRLNEVSLTATPGAFSTTPVQLVALDPRWERGGYPHSLTSAHRIVLERCHDHHRRHPSRRSGSDTIDVLHIATEDVAPTPRRAAPPVRLVTVQRTARLPMPAELAAASAGPVHRRVVIP